MKIQTFCKSFREDVLKMTLKELSEQSGVGLKTISAWEHARSSNIMHIQMYSNACSDKGQELLFLDGISKAIRGDDFKPNLLNRAQIEHDFKDKYNFNK